MQGLRGRVQHHTSSAQQKSVLDDVFSLRQADLSTLGTILRRSSRFLGTDRRIGRPEEIAEAVQWLFSDRSSYYSGQSLTLDGGLTAMRPSVQQPQAELAGTSWDGPSVGQEGMPSLVFDEGDSKLRMK